MRKFDESSFETHPVGLVDSLIALLRAAKCPEEYCTEGVIQRPQWDGESCIGVRIERCEWCHDRQEYLNRFLVT